MPGADGMNSKFMKNAFVGWTFTAGLYYPPDFDSTKLMPLKHLRPKGKQQTMNIRMMFPFTMICDACGEYNYTGTKFTAKVEDIKHEMYLGLKVYRFYGRCRHCWAEFTFKTDPKNSDYTMESGGKRTYEAWKDADMMEAQLKAEKEREAESDKMKALEQKSVDLQAEMQRLEDLDAIRTMNKRLGARDQTIEEALEYLFMKTEKEAEMEQRLVPSELAALEGFREAQYEQKKKLLEDDVEGAEDAASVAASSSSASSAPPPSTASGAAGAAAGGGAAGAAPGAARGAAIAAAVAERAKEQAASRSAVGARLSVKRKAPAAEGECSQSAAKRPDTAETADKEAAPPAAPAAASAPGGDAGGGGLGLGAYDSDDSN